MNVDVKICMQQECIPVGCVPTASLPLLGVLGGGVDTCLVRGDWQWRGGQTDACENIAFCHTTYGGGNKLENITSTFTFLVYVTYS